MIPNWLRASWLWAFSTTSLLVLIVFRTLLINHDTQLLDAFDFPYYAWVFDHALDFITFQAGASFATTNVFFPLTNTYFFSDLLLPQTLIGGLIPYLLGFNPITITNSIVITTLLLNAAAATWLWHKRFVRFGPLLFATLTTALSPFIFTQLGHVQMISFWPSLLVLGLLLDEKHFSFKSALLVGVFWSIQLLASVYLAVFLLCVVGWFWLVKSLTEKRFKASITFAVVFATTALLLGGPVFAKYYLVKQQYNITKPIHEFITYSAHPTDYLFIPYKTVGSTITARWQQLNHHTIGELATYPGTAVLLLAVFSICSVSLTKKKWQVSITPNSDTLFFLGLILIGFISSLGPRLSFNGSYVHLPLPYWLPLKVLPFLEAVRATARWSFLLYLGLTFFAATSLNKLKSPTWLTAVSVAAILLFIIELVPFGRTSQPVNAALASDHPLTNFCQNPHNLLVFPLTQQHLGASLTSNLSYKTQELLRSTIHRCNLVNGYGGFEPPAYQQLEQQLNFAIGSEIPAFWEILRQNQVDAALIHSQMLNEQSKTLVDDYFASAAASKATTNPTQSTITVIDSQPGSWYLVQLNRYDTVEPAKP